MGIYGYIVGMALIGLALVILWLRVKDENRNAPEALPLPENGSEKYVNLLVIVLGMLGGLITVGQFLYDNF